MSSSELPIEGATFSPPLEVVTFSVQVGALGYPIARAVADRLGYKYYDWEVTSRAIELSGVSQEVIEAAEGTEPLFERVMRRLYLANLLESELPPSMISGAFRMAETTVQTLSSQRYRSFIEEVVRELGAAGDAVIVGHGANIILRDRPGVLKVLVRGSLVDRARRVVLEQGGNFEEAVTALEQSDRLKGSYLHGAYGIDWLDSSLYDLVISTDHLSPTVAADAIVAAASGVSHARARQRGVA